MTDTPANRRHNPPTAPAWSATATYAVGDIVTHVPCRSVPWAMRQDQRWPSLVRQEWRR